MDHIKDNNHSESVSWFSVINLEIFVSYYNSCNLDYLALLNVYKRQLCANETQLGFYQFTFSTW